MVQQAHLMTHEISSSLGMASSLAHYLGRKLQPHDEIGSFDELERMLDDCKNSVSYFQRIMLGADHSTINVKAVSSVELTKYVQHAIHLNRRFIKINLDQSSQPNEVFIDVNNYIFAISIIVNLCREDRLFSSRDKSIYVTELTVVDSNEVFKIEFNLIDYNSTENAGEKYRERLAELEMLRDVCSSNDWKLEESQSIRAEQTKKLIIKLHTLQA